MTCVSGNGQKRAGVSDRKEGGQEVQVSEDRPTQEDRATSLETLPSSQPGWATRTASQRHWQRQSPTAWSVGLTLRATDRGSSDSLRKQQFEEDGRKKDEADWPQKRSRKFPSPTPSPRRSWRPHGDRACAPHRNPGSSLTAEDVGTDSSRDQEETQVPP